MASTRRILTTTTRAAVGTIPPRIRRACRTSSSGLVWVRNEDGSFFSDDCSVVMGQEEERGGKEKQKDEDAREEAEAGAGTGAESEQVQAQEDEDAQQEKIRDEDAQRAAEERGVGGLGLGTLFGRRRPRGGAQTPKTPQPEAEPAGATDDGTRAEGDDRSESAATAKSAGSASNKSRDDARAAAIKGAAARALRWGRKDPNQRRLSVDKEKKKEEEPKKDEGEGEAEAKAEAEAEAEALEDVGGHAAATAAAESPAPAEANTGGGGGGTLPPPEQRLDLPFTPSKDYDENDDDILEKKAALMASSPEDDVSVLTATTAAQSVCDESIGFRRKLMEIKRFVEESKDSEDDETAVPVPVPDEGDAADVRSGAADIVNDSVVGSSREEEVSPFIRTVSSDDDDEFRRAPAEEEASPFLGMISPEKEAGEDGEGEGEGKEEEARGAVFDRSFESAKSKSSESTAAASSAGESRSVSLAANDRSFELAKSAASAAAVGDAGIGQESQAQAQQQASDHDDDASVVRVADDPTKTASLVEAVSRSFVDNDVADADADADGSRGDDSKEGEEGGGGAAAAVAASAAAAAAACALGAAAAAAANAATATSAATAAASASAPPPPPEAAAAATESVADKSQRGDAADADDSQEAEEPDTAEAGGDNEEEEAKGRVGSVLGSAARALGGGFAFLRGSQAAPAPTLEEVEAATSAVVAEECTEREEEEEEEEEKDEDVPEKDVAESVEAEKTEAPAPDGGVPSSTNPFDGEADIVDTSRDESDAASASASHSAAGSSTNPFDDDAPAPPPLSSPASSRASSTDRSASWGKSVRPPRPNRAQRLPSTHARKRSSGPVDIDEVSVGPSFDDDEGDRDGDWDRNRGPSNVKTIGEEEAAAMLAAAGQGTSPTSPRSHPGVYVSQAPSYDTAVSNSTGASAASSRAPSMAQSEGTSSTSPTSNAASFPPAVPTSSNSAHSSSAATSSNPFDQEQEQNPAAAAATAAAVSSVSSPLSSMGSRSTPVMSNTVESSSGTGSGSGSGSGKKGSSAHPRLIADLKRLRSSRTPPINASRIIGALCKSSRTEKGRAAIAHAGAIPAIVAAMTIHSEDAEVQERGCAALQNLALEGDRRIMIATAGGTLAVLKAMRAHPDVSAVQERGCGAVRNFVWDNDVNRSAVGSRGGVVVITEAVRRHGDEGRVVGQAFRALRNLAKGSGDDVSSNRLAIGGAVPCIVGAMRGHLEDESVQAEGCALLRNLSVDEDVRPAIVAAGAISAIVNAMKEHPKSEKVNSQACGSLYNLSFSGGSLGEMKRDKNCKKVLKAAAKLFPNVCGKYANNLLERIAAVSSKKGKFGGGGTPTPPSPVDYRLSNTTPVMHNLPTSPVNSGSPSNRMFGLSKKSKGSNTECSRSVSSGGTGGDDTDSRGDSNAESSASLTTLRHVSSLRDNVDSMSEEEAVTVLTELGKLAMGPPPSVVPPAGAGNSRRRPPPSAAGHGHRAAIAAAGGIPAIVSFMARRIDWPPIQSSACLTLRNLCHHDADNAMAAARAGAIPAVVAGMQLHRSWSGVQSAGCEALRTFTSSAEAEDRVEVQDLVRETGGHKAVVDGARENMDDVRVVESSLAALYALCHRNEESRVAMARDGCVSLVVAALRYHPREPGVQERGCRALYQMCASRNPIVIELVNAEEAETVLWDASRRYPVKCEEWCQQILDKLSDGGIATC